MEYKEIVAVTGEPGLFQLLSSKSDGAIVRSLDGQTTKFVPSRNHNFTPLESIEVFTTGDNVSLADVFRAMYSQEEKHPVPDAGKESNEIKKYFRQIFPALDEERVYMSDMKKMLKWYPQLKACDLLKFEDQAEEETLPEVPEPAGSTDVKAPAEPKEKPAPKKKKAPAKAESAKAGKEAGKTAKKKPADAKASSASGKKEK